MRNLRMALLVLAAVAVLPGVAAATHFESVVLDADCTGWSATAHVFWRSNVYVGDLNYSITLMDQNENTVEQINWAGQISRDVSDPVITVYTFSGTWDVLEGQNDYYLMGAFHLVSPYPGGVDDETANVDLNFTCTVASESSAWSTIKALYR